MKIKTFFLRIFFLIFCASILLISCETPENETNEIETRGVDREVIRPGDQNTKSNNKLILE